MEKITKAKREEIFGKFQQTQKIYLATCLSNIPQVRPVTLIYLNEQFYMATGRDDAKVNQIADNNNIQFCYSIMDEKNEGYIRITAKALLMENLDTKKLIMDEIAFIKHFWCDPSDSTFILYRFKPNALEYMKIGEMLAEYYLI